VADFLQQEPHQPPFPLNLPKYRFAIYGCIAVTLGPLTLWFLRRILPGRSVLLPLRSLEFGPLLAASMLLVISWSARVLRIWCLIQPSAKSVSPMDFVKTYLAGVFVSHITPGAVGGFPLFLFLLHQQGVPAAKSLAANLIDSLNTGVTLGLLLAAGAVFFHVHGAAAGNWLPAAAIGTTIMIVPALSLLLFAGKISQAAAEFRRKDLGQRRRTALLAARIAGEIERFEAAVSEFWRDHRPLLLTNLLLNILYWTAYLSTAPLLLNAVGGRAPWPVMMGNQLAIQFAQYLIPTPGASGGAEVAMALLVRRFIAHDRLVTFLFLWRIYTYYISLLGSSLTIPWAMNLVRKYQ